MKELINLIPSTGCEREGILLCRTDVPGRQTVVHSRTDLLRGRKEPALEPAALRQRPSARPHPDMALRPQGAPRHGTQSETRAGTNSTAPDTVEGEGRVILLACKGLPRPTGSICDRCPSPGQLGTTGERKRRRNRECRYPGAPCFLGCMNHGRAGDVLCLPDSMPSSPAFDWEDQLERLPADPPSSAAGEGPAPYTHSGVRRFLDVP